MKKKKLIQLMKQMLTIFILVVFVTFSTGVMVTIHECCKAHHHLCCDEHLENENTQSLSFYNSEKHAECDLSNVDDELMTTLDHEVEAEVTECSNHSHCFVISYLIKITDNFVITEYNKDQVKTPSPIVLFENQLLTNIESDVPYSELEILKVGPPLLLQSSKAFINFTSQRIFYA